MEYRATMSLATRIATRFISSDGIYQMPLLGKKMHMVCGGDSDLEEAQASYTGPVEKHCVSNFQELPRVLRCVLPWTFVQSTFSLTF